MLPMPSSPDLHREVDGKQQPQKIEVPVTPPADSTVTLDNSDARHMNDVVNCKSARDLKSIRSITADISIKQRDLANPETGHPLPVPPECSLGEERLEPRHWERTTFSWVAAATYHKPIYFDDDQLERYGHTFGPVTQTTLSAVKFFATVPLVPYYMGVYPPNECIYDLGTYRPGSCAVLLRSLPAQRSRGNQRRAVFGNNSGAMRASIGTDLVARSTLHRDQFC